MTQRLKGFPDALAPGLHAEGQLHIADMSRMAGAVLVGQAINSSHLDAARAGVPIVSEHVYPVIQDAVESRVFSGQIIDTIRSAHAVGFGEIRSRKGSLLNVALKPFKSPDGAFNEFRGYRWLADKGIQTYQPVGIFPAQHGNHFISATETRRSFTSLDQDVWVARGRITTANEAEVAARNDHTVRDIAVVLADVHAHGGFLPDSQIKNWAVTSAGKIGPIDTEHFVTRPLKDPDSVELAWADINKLAKSLTVNSQDGQGKMFGVGMFSGLPLGQLRAGLEELLIVPYVERLEKRFADATSEQEFDQLTQLYEGVMTRFYSDQEWPGHFIIQHQHQSTRAVYS